MSPTRPSTSTSSSATPTAPAAAGCRSSTRSGTTRIPVTNAERPWVRHTTGKTIAEGDYDKLMALLQQAFGGTGQPLARPEAGARSGTWSRASRPRSTRSKRPLYRGVETVRQVLPSFFALAAARATAGLGARPGNAARPTRSASRTASPPSAPSSTSSSPTSANLAGWQSGLLWTDLTPKPSYAAVQGCRPGRRRRAGRLRALRQAVRGDGRRVGLHDTPEAEGSSRVK